uniref:G-protein coupled receptors family 1 profile domain-containing protein n=1 Tax=Knipowitschia caucasica TaxID=637954 RepID=A0AAV2K0J9_KNICA
MKKTTVSLQIVLAWVLPAALVSVPTILNQNKKICSFVFNGIICNSTIYKLHCAHLGFINIYGLLVLVTLCFLPVLFECFIYTRIFIIVHGKGPEVRRKAAQTCLPHLFILFNLSCTSTFDVLLVRIQTELPQTLQLFMTFQVALYHPLCNPFVYGLKMTEISKHLR